MKNNWVDGFARSLVQHAARSAPASLSERLEEEWLADFAERKSRLARLRFGIGCCWATKVIAHEYLDPKVATAAATASATAGAVAGTGYTRPDYSFLSRRTIAVIGIMGLHAVIIYGFATGLVRNVYKEIVPGVIIIPDQPRVIDRPPPLPEPTAFTPRPVVVDPNPLVPPIDEDNTAPQVVSTVVGPPQPPATGTQPTVIKRLAGGPGKGFPATDDYYPPQDIRARMTGTATVRACTDEKGRLTADPTIVQTSGSASLDQASLRLAKGGSGHYRPTTEDGRAVSACFPFRVTYRIRD